MKLPVVFEKYRSEIDAELKSVLVRRRSPLYDMLRYHLGWMDERGNPQLGSTGGKSLRPTLCLLACEAVGGDYHRALPMAAAVELVHNFSLIHDDIQDDDRVRRHRPTVWSIWGKPQAINAGTAMRVLANLAVSHRGGGEVPLEKRLRLQILIDENCLRLIEGQYLDISYERRLDVGVSDYLGMIEMKTAALIACSVEAGAVLGTDDELMIEGLRYFGNNLGLAFQIRDDILGIWGCQEMTGKLVGSDIRDRKKTLPVVYALEKAEEGLGRELADIYQNGALEDGAEATVLRVLEAVDAEFHAQKMVETYSRKALDTIDRLPLVPSAREDFRELVYFLLERDF